MLATDGVAVFRTTDGGCNWQTMFTVGPSDYYNEGGAAVAYFVSNFATSHDSRTANKQDVYLALTPNPVNAFTLATLFGAAPPELIEVSHDGGQTFTSVTPKPTTANPFVPECLSAPYYFVAPPTDAKTLYLMCAGGVAQAAVQHRATGESWVTYRSTDGGVTWTVLALPASPPNPTLVNWLVPGTQRNELWLAGHWESNQTYYLSVWHSHDGGTTWTRLQVDPTPVPSSGAVHDVELALDTSAGRGFGQLAVYTVEGIYLTSDAGKHWLRQRPVKFTNGTRVPTAAFFLHHNLHVLFAGQIDCKDVPMLARYAGIGSRPVTSSYPSRWGYYAGWGSDGSFTVAGHGLVANGLAHFCPPGQGPTTTKLLSLRVR
ncbi:MAG: Photosynthesis system assembly factor [Frankiaceae bacterium]|nr:Photosynthesis system assembly factor [Frankiaceae bacterium]